MLIHSAVLSIQSRTGAKKGTHAWVPQVENVASVLYAIIQLWPHLQHRDFRRIPPPPRIQVKQFALLPQMNILLLLKHNPTINEENNELEILEDDYFVFSQLNTERGLNAIASTIKLFNARNKTGNNEGLDGMIEE